MILVDTSAWVEFDRATGSVVHRRLRRLIETDSDVAVSEPIIAEVAAGAVNDEHEKQLRRLLRRCHLLPFDAAVDFDGAVRVYRSCRRAGVTPRGLIDCMIVTVALRHGAAILALDADLIRIATVMPLSLDTASRKVLRDQAHVAGTAADDDEQRTPE